MELVAGVDGCRGGWLAIVAPVGGGLDRAFPLLLPSIEALMASLSRLRHVAVDVPIGLPDAPDPSGRECDRQARARLGRRSSSVFAPPARSQLRARSYESVRRQGMSRQSFHILGRVREVDDWITPERQEWVHEAHPEVCFAALAGAPMTHSKRTAEGREERLLALESVRQNRFRSVRVRFAEWAVLFRRSAVARDDLLDAIVLADLAWRLESGNHERLPADPPCDSRGLRMEICAPLHRAR